MRGRRVDDLGRVTAEGVCKRHGLLCRVVWQTQHDGIHVPHHGETSGCIFAQFRIDTSDRDVRKASQPLRNLQTGCASFAVDEDRRRFR